MTAVVRSAESWNRRVETGLAEARKLGTKPPTRWEELTPGLMVFFDRPSLLQSCAERWGQEWRHVGITVQTPDGLRVACYSAKRCYRIDDLEELMPSYVRIGVASFGATEAEAEAISTWCASFEGLARKEAPYSKRPFVIGPLLPIAQRKTGVIRELVFALLTTYCRFEQRLLRRRPSFMCSTFVWQAIVECTASNLRVPISAHPDDQAAYATPETDRDELLTRWLCTPTDLWNAVSEAHRSELELDHLDNEVDQVDLIDLVDEVDQVGQVDAASEIAVDQPSKPKVGAAAVLLRVALIAPLSSLFSKRLL